MAVVSISRIQIRRGKKNSDTGIPQLAGGEFGWAVDAQELYIGNGSVAEGAPYVGNTQILTEHTNLFELANSYTYKTESVFVQTGPGENSPIVRSLQDRLDDTVSVRAFGATGDGSVQTASLQRAIDQVYVNSANKSNPASRVVLVMEAGTYVIDDTLYIPPYVTIRGAGSEKTIITKTGTGPAFRTVNGSSEPGNPADDSTTTTANQASNINISGITVNVADQYGAFYLMNCKNSVFSDVAVKGNWQSNSGTWQQSYGFLLDSLSTAVTCSNNTFENCKIDGVYRALKSDTDIQNNTLTQCFINQCKYGIVFGENTDTQIAGQSRGPYNNSVLDTVFDNIDQYGVWVATGKYNTSQGNSFHSVGYDGGIATNVGNVVPVIKFDTASNRSIDDWFERSSLYGNNYIYINNIPYVSEVSGEASVKLTEQHTVSASAVSTPTRLFRMPVSGNRSYTVNYVFSSNTVDVTRTGTMSITVDAGSQLVSVTDEYTYAGNTQYQNSLNFTANLYDLDSDSNADTLGILYTNLVGSDDAVFKYTLEYAS